MKCVNVAQAGAGNEQIYSSTLDWISENGTENVGLVIAGWSKCERMDFEQPNTFKWHNSRVSPRGGTYGWIRKSIRNYYNFQMLCEHYKVPFIQFQMISLFRDYIYEYHKKDFHSARHECIDTFLQSSQYDRIDESKFIGWPIYDEAGGFVVGDMTVHKDWHPVNKLSNDIPTSTFYKKAKHENGLVVSAYDAHPNQAGHQKIMEFIYENL